VECLQVRGGAVCAAVVCLSATTVYAYMGAQCSATARFAPALLLPKCPPVWLRHVCVNADGVLFTESHAEKCARERYAMNG